MSTDIPAAELPRFIQLGTQARAPSKSRFRRWEATSRRAKHPPPAPQELSNEAWRAIHGPACLSRRVCQEGLAAAKPQVTGLCLDFAGTLVRVRGRDIGFLREAHLVEMPHHVLG